eukprot:scaffold27356_cov84-Isochrysis_galbana.AAC.1
MLGGWEVAALDPLAILAGDAVSILLPVFYCRCVLAADAEPAYQRAAHAAILASAAAALFGRVQGWGALALVLVLQAVSTTAGWWSSSRPSLRLAASTAGACLVGAAVLVPLLPLDDLRAVGRVVSLYAGEELARTAAARLALVTIEVQLAIGHLGVAYLRAAQRRKNALLECGGLASVAGEAEGRGRDGAAGAAKVKPPSHRRRSKSPSRAGSATPAPTALPQPPPHRPAPETRTAVRPANPTPAAAFARRVRSFLLLWALPYFLQRCVFETINEAAAGALRIEATGYK